MYRHHVTKRDFTGSLSILLPNSGVRFPGGGGRYWDYDLFRAFKIQKLVMVFRNVVFHPSQACNLLPNSPATETPPLSHTLTTHTPSFPFPPPSHSNSQSYAANHMPTPSIANVTPSNATNLLHGSPRVQENTMAKARDVSEVQ